MGGTDSWFVKPGCEPTSTRCGGRSLSGAHQALGLICQLQRLQNTSSRTRDAGAVTFTIHTIVSANNSPRLQDKDVEPAVCHAMALSWVNYKQLFWLSLFFFIFIFFFQSRTRRKPCYILANHSWRCGSPVCWDTARHQEGSHHGDSTLRGTLHKS